MTTRKVPILVQGEAMPRKSCIQHLPDEKILIAHRGYLDLFETMAEKFIIGLFHLDYYEIQSLPTICSQKDIELLLMNTCSEKTIRKKLLFLVAQGWLIEYGFSWEHAAQTLKYQAGKTILLGYLPECEWCHSRTYAIDSHHFPVARKDGGKDTVNICANCHRSFHLLTSRRFFRASEKLMNLFRELPIPDLEE